MFTFRTVFKTSFMIYMYNVLSRDKEKLSCIKVINSALVLYAFKIKLILNICIIFFFSSNIVEITNWLTKRKEEIQGTIEK